MTVSQARRVAQTERTRVQSQARWQAGEEVKAADVGVYNTWSTRMVRSRETHISLNGKKAMQGEAFVTSAGNSLRYPGDPSAPAREVINCHCVLVPGVLLPGKRLDADGNVISAENDSAMLRQTKNTGVFSALPERMSKKHVRQVAAEYGIDLKGVTLFIDADPEKLKPTFMITGRADAQNIGRIDLMPKAFISREELTKTLFHEKIHVEQFKRYGAERVQNERIRFEQEAYEAEEAFIRKLKEDGRL